MSSLAIPIIFLIVSLIIDKAKNNKKNNKEKKSKTKVKNTMSKAQQQKENPVINQQTLTRKSFEKKQRVIVDREKEIFSNSLTFDKEKIVNDIIFSEILSKPKSKR